MPAEVSPMKVWDCIVFFEVSSVSGGVIELSSSVSSIESVVLFATKEAAVDGSKTSPLGSSVEGYCNLDKSPVCERSNIAFTIRCAHRHPSLGYSGGINQCSCL